MTWASVKQVAIGGGQQADAGGMLAVLPASPAAAVCWLGAPLVAAGGGQ